MPRYLVVPGWRGSSKHHWQTHLEQQLAGSARVQMDDWESPHLVAWLQTLERAIAAGEPPIVIGHSLGCIAIAHAVSRGARIAGALLVAPADVERDDAPRVLKSFGPVPTPRFDVPVTVVATDNDIHASLERSRYFAKMWGGELIVIPNGGHLNVASGHGPWPLATLLAQQLAFANAA